MNKNMTCGEGGCVVTDNPELHQRAFACHDLGYTRDQNGRLRFDDAALSLWGRGCRMDELREPSPAYSFASCPIRSRRRHRSKYRIREALAAYPGVKLRRIIDPDGDTGCFLITTYPDPATAKRVNQALIEEGITTYPQGVSNVVMTSWGLHLYYNIKSLVNKTSVDRAGTPWSLAENAGLARDYSKGTCPRADRLFETSILLPIPSCLTEQDESDISRRSGKYCRKSCGPPPEGRSPRCLACSSSSHSRFRESR